MDGLVEFITAKSNYWAFIILMMIGFYAMIAKRNLIGCSRAWNLTARPVATGLPAGSQRGLGVRRSGTSGRDA